MTIETKEERYLHAMYDALRHLDIHSDISRAILHSVLIEAEYPPYLATFDREEESGN